MSESKRSGCRGCLIWLCCIVGFLMLVVGIAAWLGYRKLVSFRDQYTQAKPLALPSVRYSPTQYTALQQRIDQFVAEAQSGRTNSRLVLSANDLNALIAGSAFSNRVYVTLTSNAVAGQFSLPLDDLGVRFVRGRYLNGSGELDVGSAGGELSVSIKELAVNGAKLPEHYMQAIRQQNFAKDMATNTPAVLALKGGRIAVENGQLIMEVHGSGPSGAP